MTRRFRTLGLIPAALVLVLAGCGSGDGGDDKKEKRTEGQSEEARPYVEAMSGTMTDDEDAPLDQEQAECFSERFIDVVGLDKVKEAGTPEEFAEGSGNDGLQFEALELTESQGEKIYDNFGECGVDMRDEMLKSMEADGDMDEPTKKCLEEGLTDDVIKGFFVTMMVSGEDSLESSEAGEEFTNVMMSCMLAQLSEDSSSE